MKLGKRKGKTWAEGVEATLFVPYTPKSALARELQEMDDQFSNMMKIPRVKIIERAGRTIMDILGRPDPWAGQDCGRKGCWPCSNISKEGKKSKGKCRKEGLVYRIQCLDCQKQGVLVEYWGETSRSAFQRGNEHRKAMRDKNPDSPMSQHMEVCHGGREPHMEMTVIKMHRKALPRQIHEAVMISRSTADILLNNKSEWSKDKTPRVKVNTSMEDKKREEREKVIEERVRQKEEEMYLEVQPPVNPDVTRDQEVLEQEQLEYQHQ